MHPLRFMALPAAVLGTLLVSGCQDSPLEPRARTTPPVLAPVASVGGVRTFSGRAADSVMEVLESGWAQLGHPEYRESRLDWRKQNGVGAHADDGATTVVLDHARPNLILDGTDGVQPAPQVLSHFQALHYGSHDQYFTLPGAIEAEMTFIADVGTITLTSLTITPTLGAPYTASGPIATGPGQFVSCTDVLSGSCDNRKHLSGVLTLPNAPTCDAKATGNVSFYANNINTSANSASPFTTVGVNANGPSSLNAAINEAAPPCDTKPPGTTGTGTGDDPPPSAGNPVSPQPPIWTPQPEPPVTPAPGPPVVLYCGDMSIWQEVGDLHLLLYEATVCFPD